MLDTDYQQIQDLAKTQCEPAEFVRGFVEIFSRMAGVELGIAWKRDVESFQPICQVLRDPDAMVKLPLSSQRHKEILNEAYSSRQATLVTPPVVSGEPMPAVLVSPLRPSSLNVLVEFILPTENTEETNRSIFVALAECCRIADSTVTEPTGRAPTDTVPAIAATRSWVASKGRVTSGATESGLDEFTHQIHQSLDLKETASNIANETRRILDCDRVTVFQKQGRSLRTLAISGQPIVNHRSNTVKALHKFVTTVLKTEHSFWYPTDEELPEPIQRPLDEYVDISMSRSLAILPIFDYIPDAIPDPDSPKRTPRLIGGLAIEQASEQWERSKIESKIDKVTRHAGVAYRNAHEVSGIFLYPLWHGIGKSKAVATVRGIKKLFFGVLAATALILAMIFVPATFHLGCEGSLVPVERQRIFADQAGTVLSVDVEHGAYVSSGDRLLVLENDELEIQIEQITGELNTLRERLVGSRSIRITNQGRTDGGNEPAGQREIQIQISSLQRRLKTVETKRSRLQVSTPIDGQVMTWDLDNLLKDRPVQQGDLLVEIANTKGEWELGLDVADRKIGHLMNAIERARSDESGPLTVRFSMAAEPQRSFVGHVRSVAHTTSVNTDRLQIVRVKVDVEESDLDELKYVGSTVNAKIDCGTKSLGFVWLHDAWEFVQYQVLFRIW